MRQRWNWIKSKVESFIEKVLSFINPLLSVAVILGFVAAVFAVICYIELVMDKVSFVFPFNVLNVFHVWSKERITAEFIQANNDRLRESIEMIVNVFVAVSSLMLYVFSLISYFRKVANINKRSSFHKRKVLKDGKEDVEEMLTSFRGADYIAIFSSTFNWINQNTEMKKLLTEAAEKKELVLYTKDKENVSNILKGHPKLLSALHETKIEGLLHLSYVERNNARYIIYRQEVDQTAYVITVKENPDSRYLIEIISRLVKAAV